MLLRRAALLLVLCSWLAGRVARAQGPGSGSGAGTGTGTCSGGLTGNIGLAVPQGGALQSVATTYVPYVFGNAECQCQTKDIALQLQLTQALPISPPGTAQLWVGYGCDNYTTRSTANQVQCEDITAFSGVNFQEFTTGSTQNTNLINIPIESAALFSPQTPNARMCTKPTVNSSIYLIITTSDPMNPAICTLPLSEYNAGPAPVAGPTAMTGDGAVTLAWSPPATGNLQPNSFQILCADACGNPVAGKQTNQAYSICVNGAISRRQLPTGSSTGTTGTDGGTTTTDAGTQLMPQAEPQDLPADGGAPSDGGLNCAFSIPVPDGGITDGGPSCAGLTPDGGVGTFGTTLDPRYICSGEIKLSGTNYTQRIDGLTNGSAYQFVVLGIDLYGNATPSAVLTAVPQPTEDLYRRYACAGGKAHGFCFIATAAWGSYEHPYVQVLREFRDRVLLQSSAGSAFVDWYYAHSPPAASYIAERPAARAIVRVALWPVIAFAAAWLYLAAWQKALVLTLLIVLLVARARRRRIRAQANAR